ncbi:MAG: TonB-dependent receptor [Bacteroidota bacterium]
MRPIYLFLGFTLSTWVSAQHTINGIVKNTQGEPISFTTIRALNTNVGAVSDEEGNFALNLYKGIYELEISSLGYAMKLHQVTVPVTEEVVIVIQETTQTLDEVVVSAERRQEKLTKTPVAVTSLSAKKVKETRTWELEDLNGLIPNYFYGEIGVGFQQVQSIRGISVFSENPAVATYIDGVNQLDILANGFQFVDIESIEVLRGPQGTLFGRNAMGGVINIKTKQPTNRTEVFGEATIGNLDLQRYAVSFKSPLIKDKLFVGATGLFQDREGFLVNDTTGTILAQAEAQGATVGDETAIYGTVFLKWLPSSQWDLTLNIKGQIDESDASGFFIYQQTDSLALANPDKVNLGRIGEHRRDILNVGLSTHYYHPNFTLASTTTFQQIGLSYDDIYDASFSGTVYASYEDMELGERPTPQQVVIQEFRISSNNKANLLNYTGGLFFFTQNAFEPTTNIAIDYGPVNGPFFVPGYTPGTNVIFRNEGQHFGLAAYGQASYHLSDELDLTAGLRYDYEDRENTFNGFGDVIFQEGEEIELRSDTTVSAGFNALSPKIALTYSLNGESSVYLSYTRGFRAGGINTQRIEGVDLAYDPEFSNNFEVGYKRSFWSNRLFLATTGYYIDWQDLQFFSQVAANLFLFDNIGDARSYGLELEASAIPIKSVKLDAAFGWNESEYQDFTLDDMSLDGNRLSNAPEVTLFTAAQYDFKVSNSFEITVRGEYRYFGETFSDRENDLEIGAYGIVNARLGMSFQKRFELVFWGRNLNDERYISYASPSTIDGNRNSLASAPGTYGITLSGRL